MSESSAPVPTATTSARPVASAVYRIRDLEQLRALSDPLRLRILEAFAHGARTTKQVAGSLGEKPTKLYHHVDALEAAGLVRLVETRPKRGTLEKYYEAVARVFEADAGLFAAGTLAATTGERSAEAPSNRDEVVSWQELAARLCDRAAGELRGLPTPSSGCDSSACPAETTEQALITQLIVTAPRAEILRLRALLMDWLAEVQRSASVVPQLTPGVTAEVWRVTLALYPLIQTPTLTAASASDKAAGSSIARRGRRRTETRS